MNTTTISYRCAPDLGRLLDIAQEIAEDEGDRSIGAEHVILAMLKQPSLIPIEQLWALGVDASVVLAGMAQYVRLAGVAETA